MANVVYDYPRLFKSAIEPVHKKGIDILNPKATYASDFQKFKYPNDKQCSTVYLSTDPRLFNVPYSQVLPLDRPAQDDSVKLNTLYTDPNLTRYGQGYSTYSDINAGQITYYIDKSQEDAFYEPNFTTSARMEGVLYKDPMSSMKPQYNRYPLKCNNHLNTDRNNYEGGLSWIADSLEHRQDLLALQMRKRNEQRFSPRWTGLNK